jgi:hypothetical protein
MSTDYKKMDLLLEFLAKQNEVTIDDLLKRNIKNYKIVGIRDMFIWLSKPYTNDIGDIAVYMNMKRDTAYKSKKRFLEQYNNDKEFKENANKIKRMFEKYEKVQGILHR